MADDELTAYLIKTSDQGLLRFECPATWKVTFGPLFPGAAHGGGYGRGNNNSSNLYLRFYESKEKQRAVFAHVEWFRPEHLTLQKQVVVEEAYEGGAQDDGEERQEHHRAHQRREFVDVGQGYTWQ